MLFTPRAASYWALRMAFLIVSAAFIYDCCISFEVAIFCHLCNFRLQRYCFFARYARGRVNFYSICECVLLYILHITAADAFPCAVVEEQMSVPSPMVIFRNRQFYEFLRIIFYEFLRIVFLKKGCIFAADYL